MTIALEVHTMKYKIAVIFLRLLYMYSNSRLRKPSPNEVKIFLY